MLRLIVLLLPALIPSWRFFKTVAPSPRVEYRLIRLGQVGGWRHDRPKADIVTLKEMIGRLFWNPDWNEQLFMVSCSERLIEAPSQHSIYELNRRIARFLAADEDVELQFRLVFWSQEDGQLVQQIEYESAPVNLQGLKRCGYDV